MTNTPMRQRLIAEFLGTFVLVFIGAGVVLSNDATNGGVGLLGIALAHGIALAAMNFTFGSISGGHVNPAVTVALWLLRKLSTLSAAKYLVAQLAGATAAAAVLQGIFPKAREVLALGAPQLGLDVGVWTGVFTETILTFFLVMVVLTIAENAAEPEPHASLAVGLILAVDILVGGPVTGAAVNPARAFGPALVSGMWDHQLVYWIGPLFGALLAVLVTRMMLSRSDAKG
jgi:MIP family channel proteins